jgi:hypothetical protein
VDVRATFGTASESNARVWVVEGCPVLGGGTFPLDCFRLGFSVGLWNEMVMSLKLSVVGEIVVTSPIERLKDMPTGKDSAKKAAKLLPKKSTPQNVRTVAASALSQAPDKKKKKSK